jgi:bla regulator protein blaR1
MSQALIEHLWQSTWFALAAALVTRALRNNAARIRYGVWFAASVKFLVPFSLLLGLGGLLQWRHTSAAPAIPASLVSTLRQVTAPLGTPQISVHSPVSGGGDLLLLALWATGCAVVLARWSWRWAKINAAASRAASVDIAGPIPVRSTPQLSEPGVVGIIRPVLLLPQGITERLTPRQLQAVLAHELCHVRRRDNFTAAIHMLVQAVFWFHPFVWWIGSRLLEERERACDENVLELGNESVTYAEGILKVCQLYVESRLPCVAGVSGANLKKRIEVIMSHSVTRPLTVTKKALLATAAAAAFVLPVGIGLLGATPAAAQDEAGDGPAAFDAVSVVKSPPGTKLWFQFLPAGTMSTTRVPLRGIIAAAYGVDSSQVVGGPKWIDTQGLYDISARGASPLTQVPRRAIKALLTSRFALVAHPETQTLPAYVMRVDAGGSKLTLAPQGEPGPRILMLADLVAHAAPLKSLTGLFSQELGAPVLDHTGLAGRYDFKVTGPLTAANLPAAVREQLGLTLEPLTMPVDVIVVDSIQPPTLDAQPLPGVAGADIARR